MTYRPLEVQGECHDLELVILHHRGEALSESAFLVRVHHLLVVLEADPEAGPAPLRAGAVEAVGADAARARVVAIGKVGEALEAELEKSLALAGDLR